MDGLYPRLVVLPHLLIFGAGECAILPVLIESLAVSGQPGQLPFPLCQCMFQTAAVPARRNPAEPVQKLREVHSTADLPLNGVQHSPLQLVMADGVPGTGRFGTVFVGAAVVVYNTPGQAAAHGPAAVGAPQEPGKEIGHALSGSGAGVLLKEGLNLGEGLPADDGRVGVLHQKPLLPGHRLLYVDLVAFHPEAALYHVAAVHLFPEDAPHRLGGPEGVPGGVYVGILVAQSQPLPLVGGGAEDALPVQLADDGVFTHAVQK